jgi:hypothetical protein
VEEHGFNRAIEQEKIPTALPKASTSAAHKKICIIALPQRISDVHGTHSD